MVEVNVACKLGRYDHIWLKCLRVVSDVQAVHPFGGRTQLITQIHSYDTNMGHMGYEAAEYSYFSPRIQ